MRTSATLQQLLLIISGSVELNPGPTSKVKYPCGECRKAVTTGASIACDLCNQWFHRKCSSMSDQIYDCHVKEESLEWLCQGCALADISNSLFDTSISSCSSTSSIESNPPKKKVSKLRVVICNFQSIYNKNEELSNNLITNDIDILIGTETHLSCNILNSELIPKTGYKIVHRCDRNDGYGGVIIIAKESLITEPIKAPNSHQIIAVKVETFQKPIIISSCYRSPNNSNQENNDLVQSINNLSKKFKSNPQFFGGDFNLPDVDWESYTITGSQYPRALNEQYLEAFDTNSLSQAVNFPTRQKSILDLLITNRPSFIENCRPTPGFGDHQTAVLADVYCHPKRQRPVQRKIYLWNRANLDQMKQDVRQASEQFLENETIDTPINNLWLKFKNIITNAQENNVPCKNSTKRYNQRWFNRSCRRAVRKKQRLFNRYKRTKQSADWNKYIKAAKKARLTCKQTCDKFINENFLSEHKSNPKKFYSYIKSKKQDNIGITSLLSNGDTFTDDTQIAKILNNQFLSVFSEDDGRTPDIKGKDCPPISELTITQNGVQKLLSELNPSKANGPDQISTRILKECADIISKPLTLIYQASLKQSKIPDDWRKATISPIYKGNNKSRSNPESYRPVSLTCVLCKTLEHIVHSHIINHLEQQNILTDQQHGFRKKRSCETQLVKTVNDLVKTLNEKGQTDAILLDFSKAFDKVCHRKLLLKLSFYGVKNNLLSWIEDFLSNRTQKVLVRGVESPEGKVTSGVPQGSVLGPLLFLVYINDISLAITSSEISLFADDALLYKSIKSIKDARDLQSDLNRLTQWEQDWSMEFNADKCKVLRFTNKLKKTEATYSIHGYDLELVKSAKYLGVILDSKLTFNKHITTTSAKAQNCRHFLQRNLRICDKEVKLQCYKTFVRPIIEYASIVWDPVGNLKLNRHIESVQRKSARWIFNQWQHEASPTNMIKSLDLQTLEERRTIKRLTSLYQFHHGIKFMPPNTIKPQRCNDLRFQPIQGAIQRYTYSFYPYTINEWNMLSAGLVNAESLDIFNDKLVAFLK